VNGEAAGDTVLNTVLCAMRRASCYSGDSCFVVQFRAHVVLASTT
jgi:hypothetical protein